MQHAWTDLLHKTVVEQVRLAQFDLEIRRPSQYESLDVALVVRDEHSDRLLGDLPDVVVPLLHPEPGKPKRRLPTPAVLLREVDGEFVDDLPGVTRECAKEGAVTVHHNKPEHGVVGEKGRQRFRVELVVAEIE